MRYMSTQFGQALASNAASWQEGTTYRDILGQFFDLLRQTPTTEDEVALEEEASSDATAAAVQAELTTVEIFTSRRQGDGPLPPRQGSPYKFLDYFQPEDADIFFGRDQEIRQLQRKFHASRLLILHGESGTGKTSLIRAGLLPRLPESYLPVYVRVQSEFSRAIKEALWHHSGGPRRSFEQPLVQFLAAQTAALSMTVVLILDQFEEFFLRFPLEVRQTFHHELAACLHAANLDVHVLIALREDYFALLAEFQHTIPDIFTHEIHLTRLTPEQALAAVVEPAQRVGFSVDTALIKEVVLPQLQEDGKGIEPPMLQIVCDTLYEHATNAGRTTIGANEYAAMGDVRGVLERYLERCLKPFGQEQPQVREVLKALVTTAGTKRPFLLDEMVPRLHTAGLTLRADEIEKQFLQPLVQARLVRVDEVEGRARYELAHEFLVPKIETWMATTERERLKVREMLERAYEAYQATGLLLSRDALALLAPYQEELVLPQAQREFLRRSQQRRRQVSLRIGVSFLAVILLMVSFFGWQIAQKNRQLQATNVQLEHEKTAAEVQRQRAEEQAQEARHRLRGLYVEQGRQEWLQGNAMRAVAYLSEAYRMDERGESLLFLLKQAMRTLDAQRTVLQSHQTLVEVAVGFGPDGLDLRLATASTDGIVRVWERGGRRLLATLEGHQGDVQAGVFSLDGQRLATASEDGTARVWDVSLEIRSPETIAALVQCKGFWRFDEGRLLPANPDPTTCPPRSPAP